MRNNEAVLVKQAFIAAEAREVGRPLGPCVEGRAGDIAWYMEINEYCRSQTETNPCVSDCWCERAHTVEGGSPGVVATLALLFGYVEQNEMENDAHELVNQCLYCADRRAGGLLQGPLAYTVHGTKAADVGHLDFLFSGESEVTRGTDDQGECIYMLMFVKDVGAYLWLALAKACTAELTVEHFVAWCGAFVARKVWVSDIRTHFKSLVVRRAPSAFQVKDRFSVAYFSPDDRYGGADDTGKHTGIQVHLEREGMPAIRVDHCTTIGAVDVEHCSKTAFRDITFSHDGGT